MSGGVFFKNLDALRFLAFLGVFTSHTLPVIDTSNGGSPVSEIFLHAFSFSYLGVPFFFTLSSFLITYRLLEEQKANNRIQLLRFYLKRGLRIWPIYFLLIGICFLILPSLSNLLGWGKPTLADIYPFLFFWSNFYMIDHGMSFISALTVLWSLAIEEQFYIFWGAMLKYCNRYLMPLVCILLIASVIFCYYYLYGADNKPMNLKIHSLYALPNFCLGAFIAIVCQSKKTVFTFLKSLPNFFYASVYILLIAFHIVQNMGITDLDIVVTAVFNSTCFGLILFDQTFNDKRLFNAGKFKVTNYLGKISYGLYVYHLLIVTAMIKAFNFFIPGQDVFTGFMHTLITLVVTILVSALSYRYFETYFLKLKDKL